MYVFVIFFAFWICSWNGTQSWMLKFNLNTQVKWNNLPTYLPTLIHTDGLVRIKKATSKMEVINSKSLFLFTWKFFPLKVAPLTPSCQLKGKQIFPHLFFWNYLQREQLFSLCKQRSGFRDPRYTVNQAEAVYLLVPESLFRWNNYFIRAKPCENLLYINHSLFITLILISKTKTIWLPNQVI